MANHLSRLVYEQGDGVENQLEINDSFLEEQLLAIARLDAPWYADFVNFLISNIFLTDLIF